MKKNQLPKQVLNTLLAYQIKSDDILDVCPFDLSFDSEYISGYLFLTSTKIGVAKSRHEQMTVRYFRGTKTADMQYAEDEKDYLVFIAEPFRTSLRVPKGRGGRKRDGN